MTNWSLWRVSWSVACAWMIWALPARAQPGELLVEFDVPHEFAPRTVCVHVNKLSQELAAARANSLKSRTQSEEFPAAADPCTAPVTEPGTTCNECKTPPRDSFPVCVNDLARGSGRAVQLLLEHVGLRGLKLEGKNLRLAVDYPESSIVTPRVEVLGANYHAGDVDSVRSGQDLQLTLRPRCINRRLRLPPTADAAESVRIVSNKKEVVHHADDQPELRVTETGLYNEVEVTRGKTVYVASFSYPPPPEIQLAPRDFEVRWKRHCLISEGAQAKSCPVASLVSHGHQCSPVGCSDACCYRCTPGRAVEFPTLVRFTLAPRNSGTARSDNGDATLDPMVWEEPIRFPGDEVGGFVAAEGRRVFLDWGEVNAEARDWNELGSEVTELEITGPDGRTQQVKRGTASVAAPGLQCHDRFTYRYRGRWFDPPRQRGLSGDTLHLEPTEKRQRELILGVHAHAGGIGYLSVHEDFVASPLFDLSLVGLIYGGVEISVSGLFSFHPSVSEFEGASDRDMSAFVRVVGGVGYRAYLNDRFLIIPGIGIGGGVPALASDWSEARPSFVATANARVGYEISRATALEGALWLFWPEQYMESAQDAAGPAYVKSRSTFAVGLGAGLQWADLL
jgi:hypothetical protein